MRRENSTAHQAVINAARERGIAELAHTIAVRDAAHYPAGPRPADDESDEDE